MAELPLRRLHADSIYERGLAKASLEYLSRLSTQQIIDSLRPGGRNSLKVTADGLVKDGNTRVKILEERGMDVDSLSRDIVP